MKNILLVLIWGGVIYLLRHFEVQNEIIGAVFFLGLFIILFWGRLKRAYKEWSMRRKVKAEIKSWPTIEHVDLTFDAKRKSLNGVVLGSPINKLGMFGQPDLIDPTRGGTTLLYCKHGLLLDLAHDSFFMFEVMLSEDPYFEYEAKLGQLQYTSLALLTNEKKELRVDTCLEAEKLLKVLGKPEMDDVDEEDRTLQFLQGECILTFEFGKEKRLKRVGAHLKRQPKKKSTLSKFRNS